FLDAGCKIFTYAWTDGIDRHLDYYTVPEEAMESAALMRPWAMLGREAALRAAAKKTKKSPKTAEKSVARKSSEPAVKLAAKRALANKSS
ncbi:MAG: TfoX/Sxy family protein, partial [Casimicrobium sp.]